MAPNQTPQTLGLLRIAIAQALRLFMDHRYLTQTAQPK
jgi:hypothetical protein